YMRLDGERKVNRRKIWRDSIILGVLGVLFIAFGVYWLGNLLVAYTLLMLLNFFFLIPLSNRFQHSFLPWLENLYNSTIAFALRGRNPIWVLGGAVFALIFSFVLMGIFPPNVLYFPENEPQYANVFIEFPTGTDIEETNRFTKQIEGKVMDIVKPY